MYPANDIASVIVARSGPWLDAMTLQKLLYYVQAWHLAVTDQPLFGERIKAWKDGPVVPEVWHARKDRSTRRAVAQDVDGVDLDDLSSDLIDLVLAAYGSMSGEELSVLTHVEQPWRDARGDTPDGERCTEEVSTRTMARFYRSHRRLGGRTAADLAAGGLHRRSTDATHPVDVDALLAELEVDFDDSAEPDPWGGANLIHSPSGARRHRSDGPSRAYAGV